MSPHQATSEKMNDILEPVSCNRVDQFFILTFRLCTGVQQR